MHLLNENICIKTIAIKKPNERKPILQQLKKAIEIKTKIETTDLEIDQMVDVLYELSEEEIKILEG